MVDVSNLSVYHSMGIFTADFVENKQKSLNNLLDNSTEYEENNLENDAMMHFEDHCKTEYPSNFENVN